MVHEERCGSGCWVPGSGCLTPGSRFAAAPGAPQGGQTPEQVRGLRTQQNRSPARELVTTYCVSCHNPKLKTGNFVINPADADNVAGSPETWEKVVVKLRSRAMPPQRSRRPDNKTYDAVAAWLETELDRSAAANPNPGRPADLHRLNRAEYANAVRDLLGVQVDGTLMLPPDEQAHGFDTNADALSVVPALLDRYLTAAAKISRLAIGDPTLRPAFERYTAVRNNSNERTWLWQTERLGEEFPLGIPRRHRGAPLLPGRRRVCVEGAARQDLYGDGARPQRAERHRIPRRRQARGAVHAGRPRVRLRPPRDRRRPKRTLEILSSPLMTDWKCGSR